MLCHLSYTDPASLALASLLRSGVLHDICRSVWEPGLAGDGWVVALLYSLSVWPSSRSGQPAGGEECPRALLTSACLNNPAGQRRRTCRLMPLSPSLSSC